MTLICMTSPKGGVGKTTLTANLAYTFQRQGKHVTVIDFDSQDALKLHFGFSFDDTEGFVAEGQQLSSWENLVIQTHNGINVLPYGRASREDRLAFENYLKTPGKLEEALFPFYQGENNVLLVDLPPGHSGALDALSRLNPIFLTILMADGSSLAVLPTIENGDFFPVEVEDNIYFVINQLDMRQRLSVDVYDLLRSRLGPLLLGSIHRDAAVPEALAAQTSIFQHAYSSSVINDLEQIVDNLARVTLSTNARFSSQGRGI
ncbi:cellulose biosynthesis protein BcsQ [Halomonas sp. CUBES01]|uniref:cellulose biosynthesis protein BcsQ n=1 Tax=Halomonas sp. CUBES01 TaxID=2897340 RepID=UPI001E6340B3|nr:cellulose biosynthesis protein BcsQ [Halomonas sp. CUBES01]MEC4766679.1 cellulose biosynthesis protein BcsQ [Halomonas sp. CUBES01]